jgi:hypothetical protein
MARDRALAEAQGSIIEAQSGSGFAATAPARARVGPATGIMSLPRPAVSKMESAKAGEANPKSTTSAKRKTRLDACGVLPGLFMG